MRVWKGFQRGRRTKTETQQEYSARSIHALQRADEVLKTLQVNLKPIRNKQDDLGFLRYPENLPTETAISRLEHFKIQAVGYDRTGEARLKQTALYSPSKPPAGGYENKPISIKGRLIPTLAA